MIRVTSDYGPFLNGEGMENYLRVGVITSPHGVHGEVKVFPTTDDPSRFLELEMVLLDLGGGNERKELTIRQVRFLKIW